MTLRDTNVVVVTMFSENRESFQKRGPRAASRPAVGWAPCPCARDCQDATPSRKNAEPRELTHLEARGSSSLFFSSFPETHTEPEGVPASQRPSPGECRRRLPPAVSARLPIPDTHGAASWSTRDGSHPCSTGLRMPAPAQGLGSPLGAEGRTHCHIPWAEPELTGTTAAPHRRGGPGGPRPLP